MIETAERLVDAGCISQSELVRDTTTSTTSFFSFVFFGPVDGLTVVVVFCFGK